MKRNLLISLCALAATAQAQVTPKVMPETPIAGQKYVLVNKAQTASQYMSATSWDSSLYFLGKEDSHYADNALTAVDNGDGTWSFTRTVQMEQETGEFDSDNNPVKELVDVTYYMGMPNGTANVRNNMTEQAKWVLWPKSNGFFNLIAGEGNNTDMLACAHNTPTKDMRMHLNNGGQYFVITYYGGPYYPDCAGGIQETENEALGEVDFAAVDSTSFNWGFVSPDKVEDYYADMQYSGLINNFYDKYCSIEDYAEGFLATYQVMADAYNKAQIVDDLAGVPFSDMVNSKVNLYKEIDAAIALNELGDPVLAAAIVAAKAAFDTKTDVTELTEATTALKKAETEYSLSGGDVTSLGTNMSFEDLSAQGGSMTTGVAGAPYGWNVFINGTQVVTSDDVAGAGFAGWHGVNDDSEGDIKDGQMTFGIWTSSVPNYELSQTISGLANGTYEISAGLMAGDNAGPRLTTQRIFGNLNSTYYASEDEYDLTQLDNSEVYAFAGNDKLVTDRMLMPVKVQAFVYDGTLTFGVRTDNNLAATYNSSVSNAGAGWFKVDNFTIKSLGYNAADAIKVYSHFAAALDDYQGEPMYSAVSDKVDEYVAAAGNITEASSQEEIIAGIKAAKELMADVSASVKAYERLVEAIDKHFSLLEQYDNKPGAGEYSDVIYAVQERYDDRSVADDAEVDNIIAELEEALEACIQSDDIEPGTVLTDYIKNASFEDLSNQNNANSDGVTNAPKGWNLYLNGAQTQTAAEITQAGVANWCAINSGDNINVELEDGSTVTHQYSDGEHLWGIWTAQVPEVELSQTIKGMPAGTYTLTCDVLVQYNWAGYCITTQRIFANDYVAMYSYEGNYENNMPEDALIAGEIDALAPEATVKHLTYAGHECESPRSDYSHTVSLTFGLAEQGDLTLGFRTNNIDRDGVAQGSGKGWFKLDNWTLTYDSAEVPAGAAIGADATGTESIMANPEGSAVEFYSASGIRRSSLQPGLNIVKMGDKVVKVQNR